MESAKAGGVAMDAAVNYAPGSVESRQQYLDAIADQEEAGVAAMEQQIADLKAGLAAKKTAAKAARAAATVGPED